MIATFFNLLVGWFGIGLIVCVLATAVAVLLPPWLTVFIPNLRSAAIVVAVVAGTSTLIYGKGYLNGAEETQSRWDAAKTAAVKRGEDARSDAERDIARNPAPGVRDKFNRD